MAGRLNGLQLDSPPLLSFVLSYVPFPSEKSDRNTACVLTHN